MCGVCMTHVLRSVLGEDDREIMAGGWCRRAGWGQEPSGSNRFGQAWDAGH